MRQGSFAETVISERTVPLFGMNSELAPQMRRAIPLEAACDVDEAKARRAAEPFKDRVFTDYQKMLADPKIDAVIIALPNFMHFDAAQQALAAGKHVFCERADAISKFDFAY